MKAKVINYPSGPVTAFNGIEYVGYEWRDVPSGFEAAAENHPYLEIEQPKPVAAPVSKPKTKVTRRRRRKPATPKGSK